MTIPCRFLFWTQVGEHAGLYRSSMDGTNIVALAKTYVKHPVSLAIGRVTFITSFMLIFFVHSLDLGKCDYMDTFKLCR